MKVTPAYDHVEFAAQRRQLQDAHIDTVEQAAAKWLVDPSPENRTELLNRVIDAYNAAYLTDSPQGEPHPASVAATVNSILDHSNPDTNSVTLATLLTINAMNAAAVQAASEDQDSILLEWVTMHDMDVRHTHQEVDGDRRPPGEPFDVGGEHLLYPGQPVGDPAIWINCRCTLAPVTADTARLEGPVYRTSVSEQGVAMTSTSINTNTTNGLQFFQTLTTGSTVSEAEPDVAADPIMVPWHGVLAPEDKWSGDGRRFAPNSLSTRELPLPLTWQKTSDDGHKGSVTVAKIDRVERVDGEMRATGTFLASDEADEVVGLLAEFGKFGVSVDADDTEFEFNEDTQQITFTSARIASASIVSIPAFAEAWVSLGGAPDGFLPDNNLDVGSASIEQTVEAKDYTPSQRKDAHTVPGTDSYPIEDCQDLQNAIQAIGRAKDPAATKKHIKNQAARLDCPDVSIPSDWSEDAEEFGRGPGWVTNPVATKRIHDYWTVPGNEGYAKIGWGTPGDFNRCRAQVGEEIGENSPDKVRFLNQICAQWHNDATGFWPGHAPAEVGSLEGEPAPAVSLVASGATTAPASWFANPKFTGVTHLTVEENGRVYGHIAEWGTCHIGYDGVCVVAPHSESDYAYFATGNVALDDGTMARTGVISLGGGHAGRGGLRATTAHYDSTSTAVADVSVGEDEHGIWCAGWVRPGTTDEQVVALRASDISGDWREVRDGMEMVAALAVNVAGFPVARVNNGVQVSLVAAGVVSTEEKVDDLDLIADRIAARLETRARERVERRDRMAALMERVKRDH